MADTQQRPVRGLLQSIRDVFSRHRSGEYSGLRVVRSPDDADIDIVAVHGLGGEGFRSWITTDPQAGKPKSWLEELLAKDIPNARIMTYGYVSDGLNYRYIVRNVLYGCALDLVRELGAQRKSDHTNQRPLFFIAHSLGGWIVKRALVISSEAVDIELKDIELSTCGAAFFGTLSPGRPSSPSPLASVIRRTSGFGDVTKNSRVNAKTLQPQPSDVEWLETQMEAFKAITANLPKLSFYETKKSQGHYIVDKINSIAGSDGEQFALTATHSDLVKFQGREDSNYKLFINKFREMVDKAHSSGLLESKRKVFDMATVHRFEYLSSGFSIPYQLPGEPGIIIRRQDLLEKLEPALHPLANPEKLQLSIASLWGPAGVGKTAMAKHYAEIHRDDISFVFWIWAESWETVAASYLELANSIVEYYSKDTPRSQVENDLGLTGVEDMLKVKSIMELDTVRIRAVVRAIKNWLLRPENDMWLLIFDHAEPSYDIFDFIPLGLSGQVLLTCRDSNCCPWGAKVEVGTLGEEQALELLGTCVGGDALEDPIQADAASKIVQRLEYHAESISRAGSTIRKKGLKISEYQARSELRISLHMPGSIIDQSPLAKTILRISAMLSTSVIPVTLFLATPPQPAAPAKFLDTYSELQAFQNPDHLDQVLQSLWDQNIIQAPSPSDSMSSSQSSGYLSASASFDYFLLDPAAKSHLRSGLTAEERVEHAWLACNICVNGIRKKETDSLRLSEIHDFGRVMAPHATTCYDDWSAVLRQDSDDGKVAWQVLGNVCMTQGATEQAIGCFELSLVENVDMDPMERIQTSLSLAWLLEHEGERGRSKEVLSGIDIPSLDKAVGFRVATARASVSVAEGELDRAEDQYETLEHEQEEALGPTDMATVSTVQKLASTLEQLGKLEEAQALYRRVYISYLNILGQSHPMTLDALEDLAHVCVDSDAIDKAEALYVQSVDIKTQTLGAQHPGTAQTIAKLAVIDDLRSRYGDARLKYQKALDIMAPSLGKAHPHYTATVENLALSTRWHAHALLTYAPPRPPASSSASSHAVRRSSLAAAATIPSARARGAEARAAFARAEELYLEVLAVKRAATELYSDEQLLDTGSKLREMYENEAVFDGVRAEKVAAMMPLLKRDEKDAAASVG